MSLSRIIVSEARPVRDSPPTLMLLRGVRSRPSPHEADWLAEMTQRSSERNKAMARFLGSTLLSWKHLPAQVGLRLGSWNLEWRARGQNTSLASVPSTLGVEAASWVTIFSYGVSYPETSAETQLLVGPWAPCCQPGTLEGLCHDGCAF